MNSLAVAIAENLDFDMARLFEKLFEVDRVVAEGRLGLDPRRFERDWKIGLGASDFHAASAAARRRRYEERKTKRPAAASLSPFRRARKLQIRSDLRRIPG